MREVAGKKKNPAGQRARAFKGDVQSVLRTLKSLFTFFCFESCKTSQNVMVRNHLHEVNSKLHVNFHYGCEALCFVLSDITRENNIRSRENQRNRWEKNLKCIKDKVSGS